MSYSPSPSPSVSPPNTTSIFDVRNDFDFNPYSAMRTTVPCDASPSVYYTLFAKATIDWVSEQITKRLKGVHPEGKNIIVPDETIISVMDSLWHNSYPQPERLIMECVLFIVDYIKDDFQTNIQNSKLSIWVQNFPEESTIRQYAPIKLREKRPTNFEFRMTY
jgi:hypothetical protein